MKTTEILIDYRPLKELLSDKNRWCQGTRAKTKEGYPISEKDPKAVRFCLLGAIGHLYYKADWQSLVVKNHIMERLENLIERKSPPEWIPSLIEGGLTLFNDNNTFEDVRELVNRLPDEETITITLTTNEDQL